MKTAAEWEKEILEITMQTKLEFPELAKYAEEMPVKVTKKDNKGVNLKDLEEYYNSLKNVLNDYRTTHKSSRVNKVSESKKTNQIPLDYPPSEDIYKRSKEETNIDPEDLGKKKSPNEEVDQNNEKDFDEDISGDDLDVPGSELDDEQEDVGSEDEENNYYSLGGDNHDD